MDDARDNAVAAVDRYVERHGGHAAFIQVRAFMIAYFALLQTALLDVVTQGLQTVKMYLVGEATAPQLIEARVACWQYLAAKGTTYGTDPEDDFASSERPSVSSGLTRKTLMRAVPPT